MEFTQKQQIVESLSNYIARHESQNKAAQSLKNVSAATISQMMNNNWDLITDDMFRNVAAQIGSSTEWVYVETTDYVKMTLCLEDAKKHSMAMGIIGAAGSGKSQTAKLFAAKNKNAYVLSCNEFWNRKTFLTELLTAMGYDSAGLTVGDMMAEVVRRLKAKDEPIVVLDEADKLPDQVLYFFITLFNALEDLCALVMCATDHLEKRIRRGRKLNKKGYTEIYSRLGRKFIELGGVTSTDVFKICSANGISDKSMVKAVVEDCENDLRRVKRKIHAFKRQMA
ncbi:ATP-binding protein [Flavobacterium kingsejongi]|uniref:ATPase n=1 Tax=Flavobacterium kingsejongi TaxID=1678728 RepID=A0A2S1LN07_9FLAO|nr:ATP-binding protein [Flavobacterium kingsejongi]AWG25051.1 ATPase [Flavobacterium kingsejongi]